MIYFEQYIKQNLNCRWICVRFNEMIYLTLKEYISFNFIIFLNSINNNVDVDNINCLIKRWTTSNINYSNFIKIIKIDDVKYTNEDVQYVLWKYNKTHNVIINQENNNIMFINI